MCRRHFAMAWEQETQFWTQFGVHPVALPLGRSWSPDPPRWPPGTAEVRANWCMAEEHFDFLCLCEGLLRGLCAIINAVISGFALLKEQRISLQARPPTTLHQTLHTSVWRFNNAAQQNVIVCSCACIYGCSSAYRTCSTYMKCP